MSIKSLCVLMHHTIIMNSLRNLYHPQLYKWKNHFLKMKGDIGMGWSSKRERTMSGYSVEPHRTT